MSLETILPITTVVGALTSIIFGIISNILIRKKQDPTLESRIDSLTTSLKDAAGLIDHIESEIQHRSSLADKLKRDVERYKTLKDMDAEEVEAIMQSLRGELKKEGRKSFWAGVGINFVFFTFGAFISFYITKYVT